MRSDTNLLGVKAHHHAADQFDASAHASRALCVYTLFLCVLAVLHVPHARAQSQRHKAAGAPPAPSPAPAPLLKRIVSRRESRRFGFGNTLTIHGAPAGSITVEGWPRPALEIEADIELQAGTEEELAQLAAVNNFLLDEGATHFHLITTGTHDRKFMQRAAKNFPKRLLAMPWKIDYRIRVPSAVDLEVYAGSGALSFAGVEGALSLNGGESRTELTLAGGDVSATLLGGPVRLRVPARSWRGRGATIRLVRGDLTVALPAGFNGEIKATVLRGGRVEVAEGVFAAGDERRAAGERALSVRAGAGGAAFTFEVGDGVIRFERLGGEEKIERP